jgi:hypothetical protein
MNDHTGHSSNARTKANPGERFSRADDPLSTKAVALFTGMPFAGLTWKKIGRRLGAVLEVTTMRFLSFLFLMLFAGAVAAFAYFNQEKLTLQIANWSITASVAAVIGVAYLLGMLSGWSVWGILRRSLRNVSDYADEQLAARRR